MIADAEAFEDAAPDYVTAEALARILDLNVRHVIRLANDGVVVRDAAGYHLIKSINGYCRYRHAQQGRDGGFMKQRARFIGVRADIAEMERERLSGVMVNAEVCESNWRKIAALIQRRCLQIPGTVTPRLMKCTKPTEAHAVIDAEIRQALTELSETEIRTRPERRRK